MPLQFRQPGPPFPTLLCPAGHLQNGLKFWLIGWSVGQGKVTRTSRCLFSFVTRARPSRPFYALQVTPKTALNFGRSVGESVSRSQGSHTNVTLPLQFHHPGLPFPTLLRPVGYPQNGLKFWRVGRLVGWLVGRSQRSHMNITLSIQFRRPGPTFPTLLLPKGHLQNGLKFWLICWSVGPSVRVKSHECHAASSVLSGLRV
jgi:hypothetical protein